MSADVIAAIGSLLKDAGPLILAAVAAVGGWLGRGRKKDSTRRAEDRVLLESIAADAAETKEGVTNNHASNLRDDLDEMHRDLKATLVQVQRMGEAVESHTGTLDRIDRRVTTLDERQASLDQESSREHERIWKAISGRARRPTGEAPPRSPKKDPQRRRH